MPISTGHTRPSRNSRRQIVEHFVARRLDVFEQLLHQLVVVIGERFQHREARGLFPIGGVAFERHDFGRGVLLVDKGAFEREIDEAGDDVAGEGRDLPQDQLGARGGLQQLEHVVDAGIGLVDLVDEQDAGNFPVFQLAQDELELRDFLLVHLADHDRGVDRRQHRAHVVDEFDRARAIEEGVGVAHESGGGDRELDAHLVMARFLAGVADRIAGFDAALACDGAGAGEDRLKQRGLAALERADQRDAARTGRSRAIAVAVVAGLVAMTTSRNRLLQRTRRCPSRPAREGGEGSGTASFQAAAGPVKRRDITFASVDARAESAGSPAVRSDSTPLIARDAVPARRCRRRH